jgi:hypothetical protein
VKTPTGVMIYRPSEPDSDRWRWTAMAGINHHRE